MINGADKAAARLKSMMKFNVSTLTDKTVKGEIFDVYEYEDLYENWSYGIQRIDSVKRYDGELYKCVSYHEASPANDWTPVTAPSLWKLYHAVTAESARPYRMDNASDTYNSGEYIIYEDCVYECIMDGTCWAPDVTPDRWREIVGDTVTDDEVSDEDLTDPEVPDETTEPETPEEVTYPEWEQRYSHNTYTVGEIVTYKGKLYKCIANGFAYAPDVYGWELMA